MRGLYKSSPGNSMIRIMFVSFWSCFCTGRPGLTIIIILVVIIISFTAITLGLILLIITG